MSVFSSCKSSKKNKTPDISQEEIIKVEFSDKYESLLRPQIVKEALSWIGTPYKYGAQEKGKSTDCSGLVLMVYKEITQIKLPRNSLKQAEFCEKLNNKNVKPGDLIFFALDGKKEISHVGIMIDDHQFVHASASKGVIVSSIKTPYYERNFKMYGRVPGNF